jgi:hypothetical protein
MPFDKDWLLSQKSKSPIRQRILSNITIDSNDCWNFNNLDRCGYGRIKIAGRYLGAHKVMYILSVGDFDQTKYEMMHDCHNRSCVNPSHIRVGTHKENMNYKETKARIKESSINRIRLLGGSRSITRNKGFFIYNVVGSAAGHTVLFGTTRTAEMYGFRNSSISECANGYRGRVSHKGYKWAYKGVINLDGGKDQRIVKSKIREDSAYNAPST